MKVSPAAMIFFYCDRWSLREFEKSKQMERAFFACQKARKCVVLM